jgi:hypothetical protein
VRNSRWRWRVRTGGCGPPMSAGPPRAGPRVRGQQERRLPDADPRPRSRLRQFRPGRVSMGMHAEACSACASTHASSNCRPPRALDLMSPPLPAVHHHPLVPLNICSFPTTRATRASRYLHAACICRRSKPFVFPLESRPAWRTPPVPRFCQRVRDA